MMKLATLATEKLTVPRLLATAARDKAVFLTVRDNVRYVLLPADDGDQEVCALQNNAEFMALLRQLSQNDAVISLEDLRQELGA